MAIEMKDFQKLKWYVQVLIVAIVCGGLLAGVWYQFLSAKNDDIVNKTKQVDDLQKAIAAALQQQKRLAQIKKDAIELQAQLETLKTVLPLEKQTDRLLNILQDQATLSGLSVKKIGFRSTSDRDVYLEWPMDLDVLGTYHNVGAFLDRIQQLPRIMNVTGLSLSSRASEGEAAATASVGATFVVTTFMYKDEPVATTAPPAKPVK